MIEPSSLPRYRRAPRYLLAAAKRLAEGEGPYDAAGFHAQQAAEQALKAVLARFVWDPTAC